MQRTQACCLIPDIGEPPSRTRLSQNAIIEAATLSAMEGNYSTFLYMLCGYTKSPFIFLIVGELLALVFMFLYGPTDSDTIFGLLTTTESFASSLVVAAILQGIGYCIAEIAHYKATTAIKKYYPSHATQIPLLIKNCILATTCIAGQIFATSDTMSNISYGGVYAIIVGTLQEAILTTPQLKLLVAHITRWVLLIVGSITSYAHTSHNIKHYWYIFTALGMFVTGSLFAWDTTLTPIPSILTFFIPVLALIEQAVLYEYGYRATYYIYEKIVSHRSPATIWLDAQLKKMLQYLNNQRPATTVRPS